MRIGESCAECMYNKQREKVSDERYLARIKEILDGRDE